MLEPLAVSNKHTRFHPFPPKSVLHLKPYAAYRLAWGETLERAGAAAQQAKG